MRSERFRYAPVRNKYDHIYIDEVLWTALNHVLYMNLYYVRARYTVRQKPNQNRED